MPVRRQQLSVALMLGRFLVETLPRAVGWYEIRRFKVFNQETLHQ
jgi:hypothetical protein